MSPAKNYGKAVEDKLNEYKRIYDIGDNPNDLESARAMASLSVALEKMQKALLATDAVKFPKKIRDLQSAIRDSTNSFNQYQAELGISRTKRQAEKADLNPRKEFEIIKEAAKSSLDKREKSIICPECGQVLGRYIIYIEDGNPAEPGSIEYERSKLQPMKYSIKVQCWKCAKGDRPVHYPNTDKWERLPPRIVFAEINND